MDSSDGGKNHSGFSDQQSFHFKRSGSAGDQGNKKHEKVEGSGSWAGDEPGGSANQSAKLDNYDHDHMELKTGTFWLTRIVLLRYVAFIYFIAFLVAYNQNEALIGKNGLLPAHVHLNRISKASNGGYWSKLQMAPTVLWFFNYNNNNIDEILNCISFTGLLLSGFVIIKGSSNFVIMLSLWFLYHSVVNVGQRWYSFGWESQLLETGFLAVFLCPFFSLKRFPKNVPCSFLIIMAYRWLIFRIMLGAGLIKLRGDKCWWDLTCMNYHYETQPVPNPMSYYMHKEPVFFHKFETLVNHFVELIAPICLLMPRKFCIFGGLVQIIFQIVLIISGNLSFLNWLTIAPCLACFDDFSLSYFFSKTEMINVKLIQRQNDLEKQTPLISSFVRKCTNWLFVFVIAYLSIPIVHNLWSPNQIMNTSFEPLRIVNTYGAFGSISKKRTEVIFQGTYSADPMNPDAKWLEYEFKCKPGNEKRWPCIISPYHYRLDWLMWFAAFQNYQHNPWLLHLGLKFLTNDNKTTGLISHNPFSGKQPPKWVRAEHYQYSFTKIGSNSAKEGKWWKRRHIGSYLPPISLETAKHLVDRFYLVG